jgi:tetratricopeptide (TPR) repeat protein
MRPPFAVIALLIASQPLLAALPVTSYEACLARIEESPERAYDAALDWRDFGDGGVPAKHCAALALVAAGRYEEAARQLEALALDSAAGTRATRVEILAQAGNAWLLQGSPARAYEALSRALTLNPRDSQSLIDRARALLLLDRRAEAEQDLSAAIGVNALATDAFVLRASLAREQGRLDAARKDADKAVGLDPQSAEAWLERGRVRQAQGDWIGARADWRAALAANGASEAGQAAQRLLEKAALGEEKPSTAPRQPGAP